MKSIVNEEQQLKKERADVVRGTELLVETILSNATRVTTETSSTAARILVENNARAKQIEITAVQEGLASLFRGMNITSNDTKLKLQRYIAMESNGGLRLYSGYVPAGVISV